MKGNLKMETPPINVLDNLVKYTLDFVVLPVLAYFAKLLKSLYDETLLIKEKHNYLVEKVDKVEEKIEKIEDRLLDHIEKGKNKDE